MANLVIIESPSKASSLKSYLGSGYKIMASVGHVRDLPKSSLGVDTEHDFEPHFINIRGKGDLIKELSKEAKKATTVYLATDPDREGEAIAWHLMNALKLDPQKAKRITFNEVTKTAVKTAIKKPREIDMNLVNSQMARRILDRIVGYKLSPYLWKTVRGGISAGRVQSVATRLIVEREEEIKNFIPKEYWSVSALLSEGGKIFTAKFYGKEGKKFELTNGEEAQAVLDTVKTNLFTVASVKKAIKLRNPAAPFTTSTLQQDANRKLGFSSARTMRVAQELYEGVNLGADGGVTGLITYMRTDSVRVSDDAYTATTALIKELYGEEYCPAQRKVYKSHGDAQDAHEAIRPVDIRKSPEQVRAHLSADQFKLYQLIYTRFMASQMASASFDTVSADILSGGYLFKASGSTPKFAGFLVVYQEENDPEETSGLLPELTDGQVLTLEKVSSEQHFTEPPARYNEGSFVRVLEEKGIGRPSTFATIVTTILQRGYVTHEKKSLVPTELGFVTTALLMENFEDVVDYSFTAQMETKLDSIANGGVDLVSILSEFYCPFEKQLDAAMAKADSMKVKVAPEETDIICEKCGARMIVKNGRFGKFAACPNYPECKNTKQLGKDGKTAKENVPPVIAEGMICEKCGGQMVVRTGKYGEFFACANYPKCRFTKQPASELEVPCPLCGKKIVAKRSQRKGIFYSCSGYPDCSFSSWDKPTAELCPDCGKMLFKKKSKDLLVCADKKCGYQRMLPPESTEGEEG